MKKNLTLSSTGRKFSTPNIIAFCVLLFCFLQTNVLAQQISVVAPGGASVMYTDLNLAITEAEPGSMVYLSGGSFAVSDATKITKPLTIMGIGHRPDNDNADGSTTVSGNFFFNPGADNSALIGIYVTGNVNIGSSSMPIGPVSNFLLRFCNVNNVLLPSSSSNLCLNVNINQNYVRDHIAGGTTSASASNNPLIITNNIVGYVSYVNAGVIDHNVIRNGNTSYYYNYVTNSQVKNNINFKNTSANWSNNSCTNTVFSNNMVVATPDNLVSTFLFGDNCYSSLLEDAFEETVFNINPFSSYQLLETCVGKNAATDGTDIGIYGGTGFSDSALPPGPRIIFKKIGHQTDPDGNLPVEIKVSVE
jgi:hypothetical protein